MAEGDGALLAPPPPPRRQLDTVSLEGLDDLVVEDAPRRSLVKSRDFGELLGLDVKSSDVQVVLYDANSVDSFAACLAARLALGDRCRYEGVDRSMNVDMLATDVGGQVVAMLGVSWSLDSMHELMVECGNFLIVLETQASAARELEQFRYPGAVPILELEMGIGALAWNFFFPGGAVPPLIRAIEDAELGRGVLRDSVAFGDGFEAAFGVEPPRGGVNSGDIAFQEFELLLDSGGRATISRAIEEGRALQPVILEQCATASSVHAVRTLRAFPAWRCSLAEFSSPFEGRIAEHLVGALAAEADGAVAANGLRSVSEEVKADGAGVRRCFAAVYEVRRRRVRVVLRSLPGGPDVSEIAALYDGCGHATRAFFSVDVGEWEDLWVEPEVVLWDTEGAPGRLALRRGEHVVICRKGERFRDAPFDEWSWGYKADDAAATEGWIPSLAHTLLVAAQAVAPAGAGTSGLEEGQLLVARGQRGQYLWASKCTPDALRPEGPMAWFPYDGTSAGALQPVEALCVRRLLGQEGLGVA